jgi:hypothetical protein
MSLNDTSLTLQQEIEALRTQFPETRALYREVCVLLFFRHGITPTANRLYQLVRRGSMNVPSEVLARFWADLREKSRVRLEHPGLPEALRTDAATLLSGLWERAVAQAEEALEAQRLELQRDRRELEDEVAALRPLRTEVPDLKARLLEVSRELATNQGRLASMSEMMRDAAEEMSDLRNALALAQRDIARAVGESNALRVQLALERQRRSRRPLGGVPQDPDRGQESLGLDPERPASASVDALLEGVGAPAPRTRKADETDAASLRQIDGQTGGGRNRHET